MYDVQMLSLPALWAECGLEGFEFARWMGKTVLSSSVC